MTRYESCVVNADGKCRRWSHDHEDDERTAQDDDGPRWSAETAAAGHEFRATALVPGWCVHCGCARFVHGGAS